MSLPFPEGTTALPTDSEQRSLQKIVELESGGGGGGSQTPWTQDIDGGNNSLTGVQNLTVGGTATMDQVAIGSGSADSLTITNLTVTNLTSGAIGAGVGASSPEGVITAVPGTHYWQTDVGEWIKNSGTGNTGWVQHTSIV